mmetsp:Transcript_57637/g.160616  ORF Transcript_57637/g.160616 Transcript_57637/m.160616 type:complete len:231 (+) Transcript_57637:371-1063(+)
MAWKKPLPPLPWSLQTCAMIFQPPHMLAFAASPVEKITRGLKAPFVNALRFLASSFASTASASTSARETAGGLTRGSSRDSSASILAETSCCASCTPSCPKWSSTASSNQLKAASSSKRPAATSPRTREEFTSSWPPETSKALTRPYAPARSRRAPEDTPRSGATTWESASEEAKAGAPRFAIVSARARMGSPCATQTTGDPFWCCRCARNRRLSPTTHQPSNSQRQPPS